MINLKVYFLIYYLIFSLIVVSMQKDFKLGKFLPR